jgi:hypothetical protein
MEKVKWLLLALWQLPQNIIGLFLLLWYKILGGTIFVKKEEGIWYYDCNKMPGAISLGNIIISNGVSERVFGHERQHAVKQSRVLGPLYLIVIGLPSILNAIMGFTDNYYDWFTEWWLFDPEFDWRTKK